MNAHRKTQAFDVLERFSPDAPMRGIEQRIRSKKLDAPVADPVLLARVLGSIGEEMQQGAVKVVGTIVRSVDDAMYDLLEGRLVTTEGVVRVRQNRKDYSLETTVLQPTRRLADDTRVRVLDALGGDTDAPVRSWNIAGRNYWDRLDAIASPPRKTEPERPAPIKMPTKEIAAFRSQKVGNMVRGQMLNCGRVPASTQELLQWMHQALRKIGVTVLSVTANQFDLENGRVFDCMAVVMESHLSIRIQIGADCTAHAYVSFFTCGDTKNPLPAFELIHDLLQPEFASLDKLDRGPSGMIASQIAYSRGRHVEVLPTFVQSRLIPLEIVTIDYSKNGGEVEDALAPAAQSVLSA